MELFASPMACSLASHITALEAGLPVKLRFVENKKTDDGGDYYKISAKGYVPALRLDDGQVLNEGPSVLQYLADRKPESGLAPAWGTVERYQLIDMLNYLSTELHKRIFYNVFNPNAAEPTKAAARTLFEPTFDYLVEQAGQQRPPRGQQLHRGRRLPRDDAELGRLPQGRPRQVADHRRLPPEAPQASVRRPGDGRRDGRAPAPRGVVTTSCSAPRSGPLGPFRGPWGRRCPSRCGAGWSACSS